jgi:hypothetical protein
MMTAETWRTLIIMVAGSAATTIFQLWLFRYKRREAKPDEDIQQLQRDLIVVRGQIKYIQGILNGKHWKRQED